MDTNLTDEQVMMRDSVRRFMADQYAHERWEAVAAKRGFEAHNWRALAELGCMSVDQPEEYGGVGGPTDLAVVCEELGRGLLLEPYAAAAVFAARIIASAGSAAQRTTMLPAVMGGGLIAAVAHEEAAHGSQGSGVGTTWRRAGSHYVLNGRKSMVLGAAVASCLLVTARDARPETGNALTWFIVEPGQAGVAMCTAPLLDRTWCAEVAFEDVTVPVANILGTEGGGVDVLEDALCHANLAVCAELVGIIDRAFEIAVEYTKDREQFGAPICTFQALRHKVADLAIDCEMARSMLQVLLASFRDPDRFDPEMTSAMAKAHLVEIGRRVCAQAIQLHGAMGMTQECGVGRYFARTNVIASQFGRADRQFGTYMRLLAEQIRNGGDAT